MQLERSQNLCLMHIVVVHFCWRQMKNGALRTPFNDMAQARILIWQWYVSKWPVSASVKLLGPWWGPQAAGSQHPCLGREGNSGSWEASEVGLHSFASARFWRRTCKWRWGQACRWRQRGGSGCSPLRPNVPAVRPLLLLRPHAPWSMSLCGRTSLAGALLACSRSPSRWLLAMRTKRRQSRSR